jgi:hypothetical protein
MVAPSAAFRPRQYNTLTDNGPPRATSSWRYGSLQLRLFTNARELVRSFRFGERLRAGWLGQVMAGDRAAADAGWASTIALQPQRTEGPLPSGRRRQRLSRKIGEYRPELRCDCTAPGRPSPDHRSDDGDGREAHLQASEELTPPRKGSRTRQRNVYWSRPANRRARI